MAIQVVEFLNGGTKLERFLPNNQHTQRKFLNFENWTTLKSLIEENACLDLSDFLSTLLAIFHVINEKFPPARLLIYLVISKQGGTFFPSLRIYSGLLFY